MRKTRREVRRILPRKNLKCKFQPMETVKEEVAGCTFSKMGLTAQEKQFKPKSCDSRGDVRADVRDYTS